MDSASFTEHFIYVCSFRTLEEWLDLFRVLREYRFCFETMKKELNTQLFSPVLCGKVAKSLNVEEADLIRLLQVFIRKGDEQIITVKTPIRSDEWIEVDEENIEYEHPGNECVIS